MRKIMSQNVIVGKIEQSIYEIADIMRQHDIGFLPIAKENKIVGVITDRDLVIEALSNNVESNTSIENYITHRIVSIDIEESIDFLLSVMAKYQIKRVLVTEKNKVVGVISLRDLIEHDIDCNKLIHTLKQINRVTIHSDQSDLEVDTYYL